MRIENCPGPGDVATPEARPGRHGVINAWDYVGYQLGEAILQEAGYYRFAQAQAEGSYTTCASFYAGDVPAATWAGGRRRALHFLSNTGEKILATHVNLWEGEFTGRDGLGSFAELLEPATQQAVFLQILRMNLDKIERGVTMRQLDLSSVLRAASLWVGAPVTVSGCLAGAHLCGVEGLIEALTSRCD